MTARTFLVQILSNPVLISGALGWFTAQLLKIILEWIHKGPKSVRPAGGGGMPSTHSSTVTALAVSAGLKEGFDSTQFALAVFLAMIVIYDAAGVRYETGQEARALNQLRQRDIAEGRKPLYEKPLEEQMGHTVSQIAVGIVIGCATAILVCLLIFHLF